jgi:hypothetical protein
MRAALGLEHAAIRHFGDFRSMSAYPQSPTWPQTSINGAMGQGTKSLRDSQLPGAALPGNASRDHR